jgi:dihydrofolate reductase/thymidylate synthase
MTINVIACVANYKNRMAIGRNGSLLVKLSQDMLYFKNVTKNRLSTDSKLDKNVVLMGRKTWFSIPKENRPLKGRLNLVLTKDIDLLRLSPYPKNVNSKTTFDKSVYFITFDQFCDFYTKTNANVFVIGGGEVYSLFLKSSNYLKPRHVFLTEVYNYKSETGLEPDTFMEPLDQSYRLIGVSERLTEDNIDFRFLEYRHFTGYRTEEYKYTDTLRQILELGDSRDDRTGVGTISIFGHQMSFDISQYVPLLTTKRVPWKHAIEELLWFMRGDTDAKILQRRGVRIWDGNTSRQFLDNRGLHHYDEGILGPGYGWQWRFFGARYSQAFADTSNVDTSKIGGFDQLAYVENELKKNPFSRRIMMSYWNPPDFERTALLPCHFTCQFYVTERSGERYLSCHFVMRSNDMFLGNPFNIFSYAVLTYILAMRCDMKPGRLVYSVGDCHIYKNHLEQVAKQLERDPRPFPKMKINPDVKTKPISEITVDDFDIIGYFPHPPIKAPMAV